MKIAFYSNYLNVHQLPLCLQLDKITEGQFTFVATERISEARLKLGYPDMNRSYPFVLRAYDGEEEQKKAMQLALDADVVIYGSAPRALFRKRLGEGKLTFLYTERIYKKGCPVYKLPWHFYLNTKNFRRYKNLYLLCASAYTSSDFAKTFTFRNKAYKWGYFTEVKKYDDLGALIDAKEPASILWVARLIPLKHPEYVLEVARRLKAEGYTFKLDMIGNGEMEEALKEQIQRDGLSEHVKLLGAMKPEQVRRHMEKSEIFLFTSDKNEGWGAVMNESMNSACAVVASHIVGSVPFLIQEGENGLIYKDGDVDDLYHKVKALLDNAAERKRLAQNAYQTMAEEWNPQNAAKKLLCIFSKILAGEKLPFPFAEGVCSKAHMLKDNWKK